LPEPNRPKEKPQQWGLGGAWRLGLLIFETQTHPVTINTMIDARIKFRCMIVKSVNLNQLPLRLLSKRRPTMTIENDGLREDLRAWLISPAIGLPEYSADLKVQRRVGRMLSNINALPVAQRSRVVSSIQRRLPHEL
jgi:hypothetical protein